VLLAGVALLAGRTAPVRNDLGVTPGTRLT
jgi:hypothetical protein